MSVEPRILDANILAYAFNADARSTLPLALCLSRRVIRFPLFT